MLLVYELLLVLMLLMFAIVISLLYEVQAVPKLYDQQKTLTNSFTKNLTNAVNFLIIYIGRENKMFSVWTYIFLVGGVDLKKIIAITNQKGGVGKTTTALSLIGALHQRRYRVLGVDLDPQGSLGFSAGLDIENTATLYDVLKGKAAVEDVIVKSRVGDLLPSNILLSTAELEFNMAGREYLLRNELEKIEGNYDYIIIDTPPALNVLTVNAYVAAEGLIIPMAPEILSLLGISQLRETVETVRRYYNPDLEVLGILLNRYSSRLILNREVEDMSQAIAKKLGTKVFNAKIRTSVAVAESPAHGESIITYAPGSKPALDFQELLDELMES